MEHIKPNNFLGAKNSRLMEQAVRQAGAAHVSGAAYGGPPGQVGGFAGPFGQVIDHDSSSYIMYSVPVVLVKQGPNGEADFTDSRYWAREVYLLQQETAPTGPVQAWIKAEGFWGRVSNWGELPGNTHNLQVLDAGGASDVQVTDPTTATFLRVTQEDGVVYYQGGGITQPGGNYLFAGSVASINTAIAFQVTSDFAAGSLWGRYKAKSKTSGTGSDTAPASQASNEDIIFWNLAEFGVATTNNLLVDPNISAFGVGGSGVVTGNVVLSGVTYKVVEGWIGYIACTGSADESSDGSV